MTVESTHDLEIGTARVVKWFRSWDRGEPGREWRGLELLHAPDLAPRPVERRTEDGRPTIVMSRLPGPALGSEPLSDVQLAAVAAALMTLTPPYLSRTSSACRRERCGLVDFEDSGVSDRAFEIADLVEHVRSWLPGMTAILPAA